jgi:hypothetical protein
MSHDDFDFEPVRGLPAMLPAGEHLLWQGSPNWRSLAVRAYHVRKVAIYFAALVGLRVYFGLRDGHGAIAIGLSCAFMLTLGGIAIGVLSLLAYCASRSTVYSITSRRLLLRHGIAVPMTMNIPFKMLESVDMKSFADGTGDIAITVPRDNRVGYIVTWPHLKPGHYAQPRPSLRALPDAVHAAHVLGAALAQTGGTPQRAAAPQTEPSFAPHTAAA